MEKPFVYQLPLTGVFFYDSGSSIPIFLADYRAHFGELRCYMVEYVGLASLVFDENL